MKTLKDMGFADENRVRRLEDPHFGDEMRMFGLFVSGWLRIWQKEVGLLKLLNSGKICMLGYGNGLGFPWGPRGNSSICRSEDNHFDSRHPA